MEKILKIPSILSAFSVFQRDFERRFGLGPDVVHGGVAVQYGQDKAAAVFYLEDTEVGDDEIDAGFAGDQQRASFEDLRTAVARAAFHYQRDPPRRLTLDPRRRG